MTPQEAIKHLEDEKRGMYLYYPEEMIDTAIKALEKQIPKKLEGFCCPVCSHYFGDGEDRNYCPCCGQHIDWGDTDKDD